MWTRVHTDNCETTQRMLEMPGVGRRGFGVKPKASGAARAVPETEPKHKDCRTRREFQSHI